MKRSLLNLLLIVLFAAVLIGSNNLFVNMRGELIRDTLAITGLILIFSIILFIILKSKTASKATFGLLFGDIKTSVENLLTELPKPKKETIATLSSQIFYRLTKIGLITLMLSFIPIWLLYNQNKLITKQNETINNQTKLMHFQAQLMETQNNQIFEQNLLQEGARRNNLQFEISSILDQIDKELKSDFNNNGKRDLSPELEGRIIALNSRLEPYYFLEGKELIEEPLSQEKGQLLISLINSKLDSSSFRRIIEKMNLNHTDLRNVIVSGADLQGLDFSNSNFSNSKFTESNFSNCRFVDAELVDVEFEYCNFYRAFSSDCNWSASRFYRTDLTHASLEQSKFDTVLFHQTLMEATMINSSSFILASLDIQDTITPAFLFRDISTCTFYRTVTRNEDLIDFFSSDKESFFVWSGTKEDYYKNGWKPRPHNFMGNFTEVTSLR